MFLNAVIVVASAVGLSGFCDAPDSHLLDVPLDGQETDLWCWAASGQMTMNFIHAASNVTQCDEATRLLAGQSAAPTNCCSTPRPAACVQTGWPEFEKYGFKRDRTADTALSWNDLKCQIHKAGKPFAFSWHWTTPTGTDDGGHMMVATGYQTISGVGWIYVNNPAWSPDSPTPGYAEIISYDSYVGGASWDHRHWDDFYNIAFTR